MMPKRMKGQVKKGKEYEMLVFLKYVAQGIKYFGIRRIEKKIEEIGLPKRQRLINYIIDRAVYHSGITRQLLLRKHSKDGDRMICRSLCVALIDKYTNISYKDMAEILNTSIRSVSVCLSEFRDDIKTPESKKVHELFEKASIEVEQFKNEIDG